MWSPRRLGRAFCFIVSAGSFRLNPGLVRKFGVRSLTADCSSHRRSAPVQAYQPLLANTRTKGLLGRYLGWNSGQRVFHERIRAFWPGHSFDSSHTPT